MKNHQDNSTKSFDLNKHLKTISEKKVQTRISPFISWLGKGLVVFLLLISTACQQQSQSEPNLETKINSESKSENLLVLNDATLEQSDEQGKTLWKIKTKKAVYTQDNKTANLEKLTGNLFQDGKIVLMVSAKKGKIENHGEKIILEEELIATDQRNGSVIRGKEAEWLPQKDLLIVRHNITGEHPEMEISAKKARYFSREERLELIGKIRATTKNPSLKLKTEHLSWQISQQKVIGNQFLEMDRYQDKTITDHLEANKVKIDLKTKVATLQQNIELKSLKPPVQIATNSAIWNLKARTVKSNSPIQIVHNQDQVTMTGNKGQINLEEKVVRLQGGVQGINNRNKAKLYSRDLIWNISTQVIQAKGNVIYEQVNPTFNLTGSKAVGKLQDNSIVVSSNKGDQVVTEIIP